MTISGVCATRCRADGAAMQLLHVVFVKPRGHSRLFATVSEFGASALLVFSFTTRVVKAEQNL